MSDFIETKRPKLTPAQQRAIEWLPKDGKLKTLAPKTLAPWKIMRSLISRAVVKSGYVERRVDILKPGGPIVIRYRLTPLGISTFYPEKDT